MPSVVFQNQGYVTEGHDVSFNCKWRVYLSG